MDNNTFYTRRNLVLFLLFAFSVMALSIIYLFNFLSDQRTETTDTSAATGPRGVLTVEPVVNGFQLFFLVSDFAGMPQNTTGSFSYQFCIKPASNTVHRAIYEDFYNGQANWKDPENTPPQWACYEIQRDENITINNQTPAFGFAWDDNSNLRIFNKTLSQLRNEIKEIAGEDSTKLTTRFDTKVVAVLNGVEYSNSFLGNKFYVCGDTGKWCTTPALNATATPRPATPAPTAVPTNSPTSPPNTNNKLTYHRLFLSEDGKSVHSQTCATSNSGVVDFNNCSSIKIHTLNLSGLPSSVTSVKSLSMHTVSNQNRYDNIIFRVLDNTGTKIYGSRCTIANNNTNLDDCSAWSLYANGLASLNLPGNVTNIRSYEVLDRDIPDRNLDKKLTVFVLGEKSESNNDQILYQTDCEVNQLTESGCKPSNSNAWKTSVINSANSGTQLPSGLTNLSGLSYHVRGTSSGVNIVENFINLGMDKVTTRSCPIGMSSLTNCNEFGNIQNISNVTDISKARDISALVSYTSNIPLPTVKPTVSITPAADWNMHHTQTVLGTLNGNQVILEKNCEVNRSTSGETITKRCGEGWKAHSLESLAGGDNTMKAVLNNASKIDSLNMFRYKVGEAEYIRQTAVINGKDIYHRTCRAQSNQVKCVNETWVKGSGVISSELGLPDEAFSNTNNKKIKGFDLTLTDMTNFDNPQVRQVILADDGETQWTRRCDFSPNQAGTNCNNWNPAVIADVDTGTNISVLSGVDHHTQIYNNVTQFRQTWLDTSGNKFVTRLCPKNNSGTFDCSLNTADPTLKNWTQKQTTSLGLPAGITNVTWMDAFISSGRSLDMPTIPVTVIPSFDTAIACTNKVATAIDEGFYNGKRVDFTVNLAEPAPGPDGTVVVRDVIHNRLSVTQNIPNYCEVKEGIVQSSVLGISDYYTENGSVLVSLILLSVAGGFIAYFIVSHNKERITSELFKEKPYLAGLIGASVVLVIGGTIIWLTNRTDFAPGDSPAATQTYLECNLPQGTRSFTYRTRISNNALPGEVITNTAELYTGNNPTPETCTEEFTALGGGTTTPSETPDNTPTPTPTDEPGITETPTPTAEPSVTDSPTPSQVIASVTPSTPLAGDQCGAADVNGDGRFTILDFGGYQIGFASYYLSECADRFENYGVCGGKDANQDGVINIIDLGSQYYGFAPRYLRETCDLAQLQ